MTRTFCTKLMFGLLALSVGIPTLAQVTTGTPPFGSFGGGPDIINLANLNSHIQIPILHKAGRGAPFTYDLSYDSSIWSPVTSGSSKTWQPVSNFGWSAQTQDATGIIFYSATVFPCFNNQHYTVYVWWYVDPFGTSHYFPGFTQVGGSCPSKLTLTSTASDGSGYVINVTNGTTAVVFSSIGTNIAAPVLSGSAAGSFTDRNGNKVTSDGSGHFYDTLSSTTPVLTATGSGTHSSPITFTYTTSTGGAAFFTVNYTNYTVATNFGVTGTNEYKSSAAVPLVTSIVLPDNSQYTFSYELTPTTPPAGVCTPYAGTTCVTARPISVTLPTGGTISYSYSGGNNGVFSDGSTAGLTRQTPDGNWIYSRLIGTGAASATLVTAPQLPYDPAGNQTFIQFQTIYETQRDVYQGAAPTITSLPVAETTLQTANLLQELQTCYNGSVAPCPGTAVTLPITQRSVITSIAHSSNLQSKHVDTLNSFGLPTETDEYDYGTGSPGTLLRQTLITYANLPGKNQNAFTQTVKILDGTGAIKFRRDSNYDQYSSFTGSNCITGAPNHDDTNFGCTSTARANVTSVTTYTDPVTPSGAITKNLTYDSLGNVRTAQLNCCQQKSWVYSSTTAYAYPDSVTSGSSAPQLTTTMTYDVHTGLMLTSTDPNSEQTTLTYDNLGRTLTAKVGTNPPTNYTYNDFDNHVSFTPWSVQVCSPVQGTNTACGKSILDKLGRPVTKQLLDGSATLYSASDTQYDVLGRSYKASNPYTVSPAYWSQANFDALGRPIKTSFPDNSASTASYTDNTVTFTDPSGKQRKKVLDAVGHLTSVYEPDPTSGNTLTLQTSYSYNAFDEITHATQGVQARTFNYDALGRLTGTTTPEAGTVCFGTFSGSTCQANGYDSFNNLLYRTDARGVITNYAYDTLNRLVGISYPTVPTGVSPMPNVCKVNGSPTNNANVCFVYGTTAASHNNGRVTSMADPSGSESYAYDQFGNVAQLTKVIGTTTYTTGYTYNLANQPTQITYPSGRAVQQNVDGIGRLSSVVGTLNSVNTTYANGFVYSASQQVTGFNYGNNINSAFGYSVDRLQLNCVDYSTTNRNGACAHDATTKFGLTYAYPSSPGNNGQISGITDSADSGRSATYTYDALYRLTAAITAGSANYPAWGLSESYDRYGNRSAQSIYSGCTGISCPTNSVTISSSTNQITGSPYAYDLSGNMTNDGTNTLTWDGENHAATSVNGSNSGTYMYDGNGVRVNKVAVVSGVTTTTVYVFSGSQVIAEYDNGAAVASPSREYIYSSGQRIATLQGASTIYQHSDHLSVRVLTDASGNVVGQRGHFPFGESWYETGTLTKVKFTTYERDSESGNDYAMDRVYVNRLGRFSSVDRLSGDTSNPQSLDRYTYALNDPISLVDPTGDFVGSDCPPWDSTCGDNGGGGAGGPPGGPTDPPPCPPGADPADPENSGCQLPGGSHGSGGGGKAKGPLEFLNILNKCTSAIYGVLTFGFTPSQPGANGSFVGVEFFSKDASQLPSAFTVINDTKQTVQWMADHGQDVGTIGYTEVNNPYMTHTASDTFGFSTSSPSFPLGVAMDTQLVELGNALSLITQPASLPDLLKRDQQRISDEIGEPQNNPQGRDFAQCVYNGGIRTH